MTAPLLSEIGQADWVRRESPSHLQALAPLRMCAGFRVGLVLSEMGLPGSQALGRLLGGLPARSPASF